MLNDYRHPDGEPLKTSAERVVRVLAELIGNARAAGVPVVWVNDHGGDWTITRQQLVEQKRRSGDPSLIDPVAPPDDAMFVFKARHSAFYASGLEYLLDSHDIGRLILAGQVSEQCILYTALDAYLRHFEVVVPRDAVAYIDEDLHRAALRMMELNMHADVVDAAAAIGAATGD